MNSKNSGRLFLIPAALDDQHSPDQLAKNALIQITHLRHFAVENIKHARRYLRRILPELVIDECQFYDIGKHADQGEVQRVRAALGSGNDIGVISEAGLPAVADPGNNLVARAHADGSQVKPLIGPGSIFLALMSSGFNGQQFTFHGYLPRDRHARTQKIRQMEQALRQTGYTQLFMEAPYRNDALLEDILKHCDAQTGLCVACDLTLASEYIRSATISTWRKTQMRFHKRPAIFLLGNL